MQIYVQRPKQRKHSNLALLAPLDNNHSMIDSCNIMPDVLILKNNRASDPGIKHKIDADNNYNWVLHNNVNFSREIRIL